MGEKVSLYNTTFEVSLRVLIILAKSGRAQSIEEISAIDFMSVYGHEFDISDRNLHGENSYKYGEAAARHKKIQDALANLSLRGLVMFIPSKDGFIYRISDTGQQLYGTLNSSFALEFGKYVELAEEKVSLSGLLSIQNEIAEKAKKSIRRADNA